MLLLEIADFVLGVIQCTFLSLGTRARAVLARKTLQDNAF